MNKLQGSDTYRTTTDCWRQAAWLIASAMLLFSLLTGSLASACVLHVEKDNMTGVAAPDTSLFTSAYAGAGRTVSTVTSDTNCTFDTNLEYADMPAFVNAYKDHTSTDNEWWVLICGADDGPAASDNDPNSESELLGYSYNAHQGATYSFIFSETIWDWAVEEMDPDYNVTVAKRKVALHESGHQFRLSLNDTSHSCIMHALMYDATTSFCDTCASEIQTEGHPGP
jgi:hypothetical protein